MVKRFIHGRIHFHGVTVECTVIRHHSYSCRYSTLAKVGKVFSQVNLVVGYRMIRFRHDFHCSSGTVKYLLFASPESSGPGRIR